MIYSGTNNILPEKVKKGEDRRMSTKYELIDSDEITSTNKNIIKEKEFRLTTLPLEKTDRNIAKSICKIKIETPLGTTYGTGFLLRFYIEQETFYCLISNEHLISEDIINNKNNRNNRRR